jgi:hypothetical protein
VEKSGLRQAAVITGSGAGSSWFPSRHAGRVFTRSYVQQGLESFYHLMELRKLNERAGRRW